MADSIVKVARAALPHILSLTTEAQLENALSSLDKEVRGYECEACGLRWDTIAAHNVFAEDAKLVECPGPLVALIAVPVEDLKG